mgnify:CR=1 FL=1
MAIAFDAATSAQATAASSISLSHTASGSDRRAFIGVGNSAESVATVTGVTYGGSSCTALWNFTAQTYYHNAGFDFIAPAASSQTVTATLANADDELTLGVITFTGAHQSTAPTTATANGSGTAPSVAVASASDRMVVDNVYLGNPNATVGAGQTQRWQQNVSTSTTGAGSTETGSATTTMSWTTTPSDSWTIGAASYFPSADVDVLTPQILLVA